MTNEIAKPTEKVIATSRSLTRWLWEETRWIGRVILSSTDRFYWDNGFTKAAALAYTSLLSLVPITALAFGILAAFIQRDEHAQVQQFLFGQFIPGGALKDIIPYIQTYTDNFQSLNAVVILTLVVTALLLLNSIEYALNQVWQVYEPRQLTERLAIFCAIIVIAPVLAVSGYYTTTKVDSFVAGFAIVNAMYHDLLPLLIDFLAFVALYYFVPKAPVKLGSAFFGAIVSALLFGWAKHWFASYISHFSSYLPVYGTVASAIPVFLFWLYVSWTIVLFGAEISYQAQYLPRVGKLWKRSIMNVGDGAMLLGTQTLVLMVKAFEQSKQMPNELEISEQLGCSSVVLKPTVDALEQAGILMRGGGGDEPLLLMRSPAVITVSQVHEAIFKKRNTMQLGDEMTRMFNCFCKDKDPSSITLEQIVRGS